MDYRIMRRVKGDAYVFGVHEVSIDGDGKINGWTDEPVTAMSFDEFKGHMKAMGEPVLDYETGEPVENTCEGTDGQDGDME